jgi:hypothetical protein
MLLVDLLYSYWSAAIWSAMSICSMLIYLSDLLPFHYCVDLLLSIDLLYHIDLLPVDLSCWFIACWSILFIYCLLIYHVDLFPVDLPYWWTACWSIILISFLRFYHVDPLPVVQQFICCLLTYRPEYGPAASWSAKNGWEEKRTGSNFHLWRSMKISAVLDAANYPTISLSRGSNFFCTGTNYISSFLLCRV